MATLAACLAVPTSISYASVEAAVEPTKVDGQDQLVLRSAGTDTNIVFVRYAKLLYVVTSVSSPLTAGAGCLVTDLGAAICVGPIGSAVIKGGAGVDVIDLAGVPVPVDGDGGGGDDALTGGAAANTLKGGDGVDQLTGGRQADLLYGGSGDDWVLGGANSDSVFGDAGDDILEGGTGDRDLLAGGAGRDLIEGGSGVDIMQGDAGADVMSGGGGADTIAPGSGADEVIGLKRSDRLNCPTDVVDGRIRPTSCAQVKKRGTPQEWPPPKGASAPATASRRDRPSATPVTAGQATGVQVHWPAKKWQWVSRCLRTYSDRNHRVRLHPYRIRFKSRYWPTVDSPAPNPVARSARLTRSCG
jgi:Ca2+-binding RTX toxin-like protein